jgi:succinyl-CoA synthetase beta subunit
MDGSRLAEGKSLLSQSGLKIEMVDDLGDGAAKIVQRVIKTQHHRKLKNN